jgi:hypothetical protein
MQILELKIRNLLNLKKDPLKRLWLIDSAGNLAKSSATKIKIN